MPLFSNSPGLHQSFPEISFFYKAAHPGPEISSPDACYKQIPQEKIGQGEEGVRKIYEQLSVTDTLSHACYTYSDTGVTLKRKLHTHTHINMHTCT